MIERISNNVIRTMRRITIIFLAFFFVLQVIAGRPAQTHAQVGDAWALIAEVNALRAAYGLPPYEVKMRSCLQHRNTAITRLK